MNRKKIVAVIDYGMGNLRSVSQALLAVSKDTDWSVIVTARAEDVRRADRVVLPGQGAMPDCMQELRSSGLQEAVLEAAQAKPLFGVCIGMQMLLEHSAEGDVAGLALIPGQVLKFELTGRRQPDGSRFKVPQMGWNRVWQVGGHPVWQGVGDGSHFYFVHSYYGRTSDVRHTVGETEYGSRFTSAIARDNIFATQFHPEKSADNGLTLYRNFLSWKP